MLGELFKHQAQLGATAKQFKNKNMSLFNVYSRFQLHLTKAEGNYVFDAQGRKFLDLYGGHGVISVGHSHPHYVEKVSQQLQQIGFYSNSIDMPLQNELAQKLKQLSGYKNHQLFLCNSGAEANENAIKLASFHTGKKKMIAFKGGFHGRTAAALNVTYNKKLSAPITMDNYPVEFLNLNEKEPLLEALQNDDVAAVIVEGIQGVGGLDAPTIDFLQFVSKACKQFKTVLILDEIQSGYGRTGKFFAHQHADIVPDIISMAKGMGNGFPIGGVLISDEIQSNYGMLGTTFGGNHLACAAGIAVLEIIEKENLIQNAAQEGEKIKTLFQTIPGVKQIKGNGLMLGIEFDFPIKALRSKVLYEHQIFTGSSANPNLIRILPPLGIKAEDIVPLVNAIKEILK